MHDSILRSITTDKHVNLRFLIYLFPLFFTFDLINTFTMYVLFVFGLFLLEKINEGFKDFYIYDFMTWLILLLWSLLKVATSIVISEAVYYCYILVIIPFLIFIIIPNIKLNFRSLGIIFDLMFLSGIILSLFSIYVLYETNFSFKNRIPSLWIHYNLVAGYIMILFFFNLTFLVNEKNRIRTILYVISLTFILLALLLTQTRGVWLSTMVGVAFYVLKRPKLIIPVFIVVVILMLLFYGVIVDRYLSVVNFGNDVSSLGRLQAWLASVLLIKDNIFWGYGFDSFRYLRDNVIGAYFVILPHSHNTYLALWLDLGLFGLILYLSFFVKSFYYSIKLRKKSNPDYLNKYLDGLQMTFVGFIVAFMFEPYFTILGAINFILWFIIAITYYLKYNIQKMV